jgi:hypothetical protein
MAFYEPKTDTNEMTEEDIQKMYEQAVNQQAPPEPKQKQKTETETPSLWGLIWRLIMFVTYKPIVAMVDLLEPKIDSKFGRYLIAILSYVVLLYIIIY